MSGVNYICKDLASKFYLIEVIVASNLNRTTYKAKVTHCYMCHCKYDVYVAKGETCLKGNYGILGY